MVIGRIMRTQVPMFITFDEEQVSYVVEHVGQSIQLAYEIIEMFGDPEGLDYE